MPVHRVLVTGRVQGVGFRWFVREEARRQGIAGWVRNRTDGSVEVAISGPQAATDSVLAALRRGPRGAHVEDVQSLPTEALESLPHPFVVLK